MRITHIFLLIPLLSLMACSKTTVVLLPDDNGEVGKITVSAGTGSEKVSDAYGYTQVAGEDQPAATQTMDQDTVQRKFGQALGAEPRPTKSYQLFFHSDSTEMLKESETDLPKMIKAILAVDYPEISVIGHTDRSGGADENMRLSIKRGKAVKEKLVEGGVPADTMTLYYYGENAPVIPTADNVSEPKNRRVEIFVR